jgi:Spy/CpxP family protein refolding chaperone
MKKHLLIGTTVSLLITACAGAAMAYQNPNDQSTLNNLNLTATQQQKIAQLRQDQKNDHLRAQLKTKMEELNSLKSQNPVNQTQVNATANEINSLKSQINKEHPSTIEKLKNILNPKQLVQFGKNIGSDMHRFSKKHGLGKIFHHNQQGKLSKEL